MNVGSHPWHFSMLEKKHRHLGRNPYKKDACKSTSRGEEWEKSKKREGGGFLTKGAPKRNPSVQLLKKRSLSDKQHGHH